MLALFQLALAGALALAPASGLPAVCIGCDLARADLHGRDLHAVKWVGTDLRSADLRAANLRGAHLAGVDFTGADLRGADLRDASLAGVDLRDAKLDGARFEGARLAGVDLSRSTFAGLPDAQVRALLGQCAGCDVEHVDLHGRDLHGIAVVGSSFRDSDLRGANVSGATLCSHSEHISHNGDVENIGRIVCADLAGADLRGTDLRGVQLCDEVRGNRRDCRAVDAATLRTAAHANLDGAVGP